MKTYSYYMAIPAKNEEDVYLKRNALAMLAKKLTGRELDTARQMLLGAEDVNEETKSTKAPRKKEREN
ncbi:MAG: hypothetical protein ACXVP0_18785 [Bacteroidia bacterium]